VEWKTLREVAEINTGQKPPIIFEKPTNFDYINAGTSRSGYCEHSNCEGDTITTPSRGQGGIGYVGYQSNLFWLGPLCYKIKSMNKLKLINKFIFYYLQSEYQLILSLKKEGGVPAVNKSDLEKLPIPIPPLTVQTEIVRILDTFTDLTAELTAELTSRKMQYNYYREQLLNFDEGEVEWKTLGEVCRFINGRAYKQPELLESGKYPVLRVGNFFTNGNWYYSDLELEEDKYCDNGDLLYAWSASFGPKIWEGGKVIYHYHIWKVIPNISLIQKKFLFYLLAWDTESLKSEHGTGSTMMHIGKGSIEQRLVPIPPLEEQARIVSILDKFDTLTTSITEGLPKEIELRKKQYEYYRDRLLNFNKLNIDDEKR
jgi:type I restriction enzyme S subunit